VTSSAVLQAKHVSASRSPRSQFDLNCSNFTQEQLKKLNLARGISGAVSLLTVASILLFLVFYKAYTTTLQRLFVHLTIVTCLHDVSYVLQLEHQFEYYGQKQFCEFVGFLVMWASTLVYTFIIGINVFLVYTVYRQLRGDPFSRLSNSKYPRLILECFLTFLMIFLPLTYLWLPFTKGTYGTGSEGLSAFCWIKGVEDDCKTVQPYSQVIYAEVFLIGIACILHLLFTVGISIVFCRFAHTYRGMKHKHLKNVRDVLLLMCFLLISLALDSPGVVVLLVTVAEDVTTTESYAFWMYSQVGPPISMLIYPTGFFFYLYSLKKLKWESIKRAAAEWGTACGCKRKQKRALFRRSPVTQNLSTNPSSHPRVIPSSSFFVVPHTEAFSNTEGIAKENQPLISHNDT